MTGFHSCFLVALRMVARRPARSLLAAFGLALALAALIVAQSLALRGRLRALAEIRDMGATVLIVSAELSRNRGARARTGAEVRTLTMLDERELARSVSDPADMSAEFRTNAVMKVGSLARVAAVAGVEPAYARIRGAPVAAGRFFTDEEDREGARVAVIGAQMARDLFLRDSSRTTGAVGTAFRIGGVMFSVIGVLPPRGTGLDAFDEDNVVFIPLKTARRRLFRVDYVQRIFVRVCCDSMLTPAAAAIVDRLRKRHHAAMSEPLDFRVQDQRRLVNLRLAAARNLGIFERVVVGVLVGASALGMLALQMLSVRERWMEIGTRRALGATRAAIFWQFVCESAFVTTAGGATGIVSGHGVARLLGTAASAQIALAGAGTCIVAALLAGATPAWRAASLRPVVALRQG